MANDVNNYKAKWGIMIYMAVDDAVGIPQAKRFLEELDELKEIIATQNTNESGSRDVRICLQAYTNWPQQNGNPGGLGSRRFEIDENFSLDHPLDVSDNTINIPMGNSAALSGFINWCKGRCEAENNLLFLWGHGTGSSMFSLQDSYERIKDLYDGDITLTDLGTGQQIINKEDLSKEKLFKDRTKVKIRITLRGTTSIDITVSKRTTEFYKGLPSPDKKGTKIEEVDLIDLLPDGNNPQATNPQVERLKKYLTSRSNLDGLFEKEISNSLKETEVDLLLIMGCCMQMVEFGYELSKSEDTNKSFYYVASEELIYFDGYNYKDSFKALVEDPFMLTEALAKRIVLDAPVKNTYTEFERQSLAISCVDLKKSKQLADYIDKFASLVMKFKDDIKVDVWEKIKSARRQCRHFGEDAYTYSFIDVTWFFIRFNELVKRKFQKYPKEFRDHVVKIINFLNDEYIVQPWIGAGRIPSLNYGRSYGAHGVGIYFPESKKAHDENVTQGLGIPFNRIISNGNGTPGEKLNPVANEFTKDKENWSMFIEEYIKNYGEVSSYPLTGSLVPIDNEKKKLIESNKVLIGIVKELLYKNKKLEMGR